MILQGSRETLLVVEGGVLVAGNRIAVPSSTAGNPGAALLCVRPNSPSEVTKVVRPIPRAELAGSCVALGADLAMELAVEGVGPLQWTLTTEGFDTHILHELSLELCVERPLEQVVEELNRSRALSELQLYVPGNQDIAAAPLDIGNIPFRVLKAEPHTPGRACVLEVDAGTRIQVFAPGVKSGVDIVILADCSGSMDADDLTDSIEQLGAKGFLQRLGGRPPSLHRDEAQRRALRRLLDLRLTLAGRVSRIALVGFNDDCAQRFPRGGGMRDMDESTPPEVVQEFRDAIGLLRAETAGTDIGKALHFAAELLVRHGHPANDRLIVLVSDGAHWSPKGDEATGEETAALKEPISLTAHLHRDLKINLHAIGIGTESSFRQWYDALPGKRGTEPPVNLVPNHRLLEELVRVGGGDPTRVGDADVLETYFSGLGMGVTRRVVTPRRDPIPEASKEEIELISRKGAASTNVDLHAAHANCDALVEEIRELYNTCNEYSARERERPAFRMTNRTLHALFSGIQRKVSNAVEFQTFILAAHQTFYEARDIDGKKGDETSIEGWLNDLRMRDLNSVRVSYAHDLMIEKKSDNLLLTGGAFRRWVGVSYVENDDVARWALVQAAILTDIRDVLTGLRDMYRVPGRIPPTKPVPATGIVWRD
ncbi:MAG: von Willebrand factor type [Bradyrhizobium sp.]|nr:von Willebrand factor type [Bradyrhizobium sp.]